MLLLCRFLMLAGIAGSVIEALARHPLPAALLFLAALAGFGGCVRLSSDSGSPPSDVEE